MPGSPRGLWQVETEVVRVGALAPEPIGEKRRAFHEWLAKRLVKPVSMRRTAQFTRFVPPDDIRNSVLPSTDILGFTTSGSDRELKIIDCSGNRYGDLGENFLHWVASCATKFATRAEQVSVILLPSFPNTESSSFWNPIIDLPADSGTVVVMNKAGDLERHGGPRQFEPPSPKIFRTWYRELNGGPRQDFEDKVIRRIGHFDISEQHCSHFFFDGSRAVAELADLLHEKITSVAGKAAAKTTLIIPAKTDQWMEQAVTATAGRLTVPWIKWPMDPAEIPPANEETNYMFLVDFMNTGATYTTVARQAREAGYRLHRYSVAAFMARDCHVEANGLPAVQAIKQVTAERVARDHCDQCKLTLPHTDKYHDEFAELRSYDAWHILTSVGWGSESYGPPVPKRLKHFPPFEEIFDKFGDCLAYKLELVMQEVAPGAVVVCPEEPAVQKLVRRMQPWAEDRMVAVPLPREALVRAEGADPAGVRRIAAETGWGRQLEHLSQRQARVVVLDEMNASNETARQMLHILKAFAIHPRAYTPIFNFVPAARLDEVPIRALYELPSPRRLWS